MRPVSTATAPPRLVEQGVIAKAEFDTATATFKVAEGRYQDAYEEIRNRQGILAQRRSELALARQQLKDTVSRAPIDGIVQEKKTSVGEYLAAGAAVVDIVKMDPLRLQAQIPERESQTVRTGQDVRVTVEGDQNVYLGKIMRLSPVIAEQNRMLMVEADVRNNGKLRPGSFAHAEIVTNDAKMAVTVPNNAIVTFAGIEKVIVVQNGKALEKPITTGRRNAEFTEIVVRNQCRGKSRDRSGQPAIRTACRSSRIAPQKGTKNTNAEASRNLYSPTCFRDDDRVVAGGGGRGWFLQARCRSFSFR